MCLGAIYRARPKAIYYANTRKDAADIGFDDDFLYEELKKKLEERERCLFTSSVEKMQLKSLKNGQKNLIKSNINL